MKKTHIIYILALISLFSSPNFAQERAISSITANNLKAHLSFLSSDLLKGRKPGSPEQNIAALYIKSQLKAINIKPVNEDYFQQVDFVNVNPDNINTHIKIENADSSITIYGDSMLSLFPFPETFNYQGPLFLQVMV